MLFCTVFSAIMLFNDERAVSQFLQCSDCSNVAQHLIRTFRRKKFKCIYEPDSTEENFCILYSEWRVRKEVRQKKATFTNKKIFCEESVCYPVELVKSAFC